MIALVLSAAYLTYRFWELPARRWINSLSPRPAAGLRPVPDPASSRFLMSSRL